MRLDHLLSKECILSNEDIRVGKYALLERRHARFYFIYKTEVNSFGFFITFILLNKNEMNVINLIAGPRNLSTAIMYSFAQRKDCVVIDEPFYGHYLSNSELDFKHVEFLMNSNQGDRGCLDD